MYTMTGSQYQIEAHWLVRLKNLKQQKINCLSASATQTSRIKAFKIQMIIVNQKVLLHDQQFIDPTATVNQMQTQSSAFNNTLDAPQNSLTILNHYQQQAGNQEMAVKFTPSRLLEINSSTEKKDYKRSTYNQIDFHQRQDTTRQEITQYLLNDKLIRNSPTHGQPTLMQEYRLRLQEHEDISDDSYSYLHENEISKETNQNDGPNIVSSSTKQKIKSKNSIHHQLNDFVNVQDFSPHNEADSYSEKMKNDVIKSFNNINSKQLSPSKSREEPMFKLHKNFVNPSDCSSILNESTNLKDMMMNRYAKKRLLSKQEIIKNRDATLNLDSLPSQQTMTMSSPSSTKINMILELNLRLANLKELSEQLFVQNMFIRQIDVRNNRLCAIPDSICDLPHLWKIRLDYNYLLELPENIGYLPKLEYFSASQNKISQLPQSLVSLGTKLGVLQFNDNQLKSLPKDFGKLSELRSLLLHNNHLWEIPTSISRMAKLSEFSLDWFGYHFRDRQIPKIQKDETGKLLINEFISFLQVFDKCQNNTNNHENQVSFMHYIMYFHKLLRAADLLDLEFPKKRSIFHMLALNGNQHIFQELYSNLNNITRVDINQLDEEESTPLLLAIKNKRKDFVKYLCKQPLVNINKGSFKYGYPLHMLILTHDLKLALKFIRQEQSQEHYRYLDINVRNEEGNNAMHFLFMNFSINTNQSILIAEELIKKGINPNALNKNDLSPLHLAILGSNYEAIEFALYMNKKQRNESFSNCRGGTANKQQTQMFDFNLRGGKFNQNCLHLAVASSNIRTVMILLQSSEYLNFQATDDEGRLPKDICPYNSPYYKLLIQYEQLQAMKQKIREQDNDQLCLDLSKQEVAHYNMNRRVCESPKTTRKRMIDRARNNSLNLYSSKRLKTYQSQGNLNFGNCRQRQNSNTNYDPSREEGEITHHKTFSLDRQVATQSHHRMLSGSGLNTVIGKTHIVLSSMNDESNYGVDEFSNLDLQTVNNKKSPALIAQNLNRNILTKYRAKPKVSQQISIDAKNKDCIIFRKKRQSQCGQNQVVITSNISSPNDSIINTKPQHSKNISDLSREQFILQQPFRLEKNESVIDKSPCSISRLNQQQNPYHLDPNYADAEEDEANIPEEDINRSSENQNEAKSPIRVLQKTQTASGNQSMTNQQKLMSQAKRIIDEIKKCQNTSEIQSEGRWKISNMNHQFNRQSHLSFTHNVNSSQQKMSVVTNQEQGNYVNEMSQLCIVTDDFIGIQAPQEDQFSPKFTHNQKEFNNLKSKLNNDIFKDNQNVYSDRKKSSLINNIATYETMYHAFVNKSCNFKQALIENLQSFSFLNPNDSKLVIDTLYIALSQLTTKDIQELFLLLIKLRVLRLSYQHINRRFLDFIIFELLNAYQIKAYQQQKTYQCRIVSDGFDQQHMETDSYPHQSESIQKIRHIHKSPSFKAMTYKSPSNSQNFLKESLLSRQQNTNMYKIKDFSSTQNLLSGTSSNELKNFINISSITSNFQNSRKMSTEGNDVKNSIKSYRENLTKQIVQPLKQKPPKIEIKTSQTNTQVMNTERLLNQQQDVDINSAEMIQQQRISSKKQSISNEQEPYHPKLSGSLFLHSIEIQSKKLKDQTSHKIHLQTESRNSTNHNIMRLDKTDDSQLYYQRKQLKPSNKVYQKTTRERQLEEYEVYGNINTENQSEKNPMSNSQSIQSSRIIQHFQEDPLTFTNSRNELKPFTDRKESVKEHRYYQSHNPIQTLRSFDVKQSTTRVQIQEINSYSPEIFRKDIKSGSGKQNNRHLLNTNSTIQRKQSSEMVSSSRSSIFKKKQSSRQNLFPGKIQILSSSKQTGVDADKSKTLSKTDKSKVSAKQSPIKSTEKITILSTCNSNNKSSARKLHPYKPKQPINYEARINIKEFSPQVSHRIYTEKINKTSESDKKLKISMSLKKF
ncbi:leucine rich repeat family protein [Stylonychia lemnae]|uniref:Leucine rich repeat family protein n=1 Tax=Stylonychia lemnae TaxID=5949 RepID=A0A078AF23_STYLE|nr:leucine rich repeat family protein [Stylonychia lemnae]|eukprot:CDW80864.1 leucine rich repeat family protein [Stylonychia lemnae]